MFPSETGAAPEAGGRDPEVVLRGAEDRLAGLCGTVNVATAAMVDVIAEVAASGVWGGRGYQSVEHWAAVQCGLSPQRAKALCGLARRAGELVETLGRFREGRLSEDQVVPIARHVPARFEAAVADLAEHTTPSQIARVAASYRFENKPDDNPDNPDSDRDRDRDRDRRRSLSFGWDDDGNLRGSFHLPADQGAIVKQALEASRGILFNEHTAAGDGDEREEFPVTWADALVRMADVALGSDATNRPAADRYETIVHLNCDTLDALDALGPRDAHLHLGPAISPGMLRYLTCDGSVRVMLEQAGVPINEGRKYRTVPRKIRRAVENRDRGCRFPGCTNTHWVDIHHIIHWQAGGPTETPNLEIGRAHV